MKKQNKVPEINNLVAKHARTFNLAHTFKDRKKSMKKGDVKYKNKIFID